MNCSECIVILVLFVSHESLKEEKSKIRLLEQIPIQPIYFTWAGFVVRGVDVNVWLSTSLQKRCTSMCWHDFLLKRKGIR